MKKLLIVLFGALILGSCAEPECEQYYGEDIADVELKSKKERVVFTGISSPTGIPGEEGIEKLLPNGKKLLKGQTVVWYDNADSPLVTGQNTFYVKQKTEVDGTFKYWGKAEIIVDGGLGTWDMTWHGYLTFTPIGPQLIAEAVGQGKSGEVKGMVAKWTYTFVFVAPDEIPYYEFVGYYK